MLKKHLPWCLLDNIIIEHNYAHQQSRRWPTVDHRIKLNKLFGHTEDYYTHVFLNFLGFKSQFLRFTQRIEAAASY